VCNVAFDAAGAVVRFEVVAERAGSSGVQLASDAHRPAGVPLSARLLHDLPAGQIIAAARSYLAEAASSAPPGDSPDLAAARQHFAAALRERPGRRGRTDLEYAKVAREYADLVAAGDEGPVLTLAKRLIAAESTIRNQLTEARKRGLLTSTRPGRAGGRLTARATRILKDAEQHVPIRTAVETDTARPIRPTRTHGTH
jgi:hypothetical protein